MTRSYPLIRGQKQIDLPSGFSWTTFFFGFWPSVVRMHFGQAFKIFFFEFVAWTLALGLMSGAGNVYGQVPPALFVFILGLLIMLRAYFAKGRNLALKAWYFEDGWQEFYGHRNENSPVYNTAS